VRSRGRDDAKRSDRERGRQAELQQKGESGHQAGHGPHGGTEQRRLRSITHENLRRSWGHQ
jgi:hypothetical protein